MPIRPQQRSRFSDFARQTAYLSGKPGTFWLAVTIIAVWGATGPLFHYSDTWQLVINTGTTIVTFLMVFLIQNTQNRDAEALQIKIDELIRVSEGAHNALLDLEEYDVDELHRLRTRYERLAENARMLIERGKGDTNVPDLPIVKDIGTKSQRKG